MLSLCRFRCIKQNKKKQRKFNITPFWDICHQLTYRDKIKNLWGYSFEKFFNT